MDKRIKALFILLIAGVLVTDAVGYLPFLSRRQIRLNAPVGGQTYDRSFLATGDAWTSTGLPPVEVQARNRATGEILTFPAERLTVKYRGVAVSQLAIYSSRLTLPEDGEWEIRSVMGDMASRTRTVTVRAGAPDHLFKAFSSWHMIPLAVLISLMIAIVLRYRKPRGETEVRAVSLLIALVLLVGEFSYHIYWVSTEGFSASNSLMLHMCGIAVFFVPFLLFMKEGKGRQVLFELAWFWGLGGAFQACLAPDIWAHSFPELRYFTFFTSHGMLVLGPLFFALTSGVHLTVKSYLRAGAITLGATVAAWGINQVFRWIPPYEPANYFAMGYPVPTGSIIDTFADIFGPSPRYGIGLALMGIALFALLYAPFPIVRLVKARVPKDDERLH